MKKLLAALVVGLVLAVPAAAQVKITPLADVSVTTAATLIKAGNAYRYALSCTNTHATIHVRWGNSTVTTTTGQQLRATSTIEILSRGPVYMIAESSSVTVACTEEEK